METQNHVNRLTKVLQIKLEEQSVIIQWIAWPLKIISEVAEKFWKDNCLTFAASLAFTNLLALVPLVVVSLSILSSFDFSKSTVLSFMFAQLLPNKELARVIESNIDTFSTNVASFSIFGVLTLALISVWMMSTIESAFNMIWKVEGQRPMINQFLAYWSTLTFSPILIAISIIATAKIKTLIMSENWAAYTYLQSFMLKAIPYALIWGAFFLLYKLIPYTTVHFKSAWIGSIAAGTLFENAKLGFNYYLQTWASASYTALYGALATIPIVLFWLYVTWLIVLLGAVITYAIQYPREIKSKKHEGFDRAKFPNYYALRLLVEATRSFEAGDGSLNPRETQEKLEITGEFYSDILRKLKRLDIIEFTDGSSENFLIKKPPESIKVVDVLISLNNEILNVPPTPDDSDRKEFQGLFEEIHSSMVSGIKDLSLLSLTLRLEEGKEVSDIEMVKKLKEGGRLLPVENKKTVNFKKKILR